jgi:hypothetical protein
VNYSFRFEPFAMQIFFGFNNTCSKKENVLHRKVCNFVVYIIILTCCE